MEETDCIKIYEAHSLSGRFGGKTGQAKAWGIDTNAAGIMRANQCGSIGHGETLNASGLNWFDAENRRDVQTEHDVD